MAEQYCGAQQAGAAVLVSKSRGRRKSQRGLSLVELLVALSLGVFVSASAIQVFVGSRQSLDIVQANTSMQESARFAFYFMNNAVRQAGYLSTGPMTTPGDVFARELVSKFNAAAPTEDSDIDYNPFIDTPWEATGPFADGSVVAGDLTYAGGNISATIKDDTDVLQIRLQGEDDGSMLDCEGQAISALGSTMTFFLGDDDQLYCQVDNRAHVALVAGVENLQVLFGVSSGVDDRRFIVDEYSAAPTDWSRVLAVRTGLVAASENDALDSQEQKLEVLDVGEVSFTDRKSRQSFVQTTALRSNLSE